jgi:hypothetical protein
MSESLREFQASFFAALLGNGGADAAWARQPGFAIHRNSVIRGAIDALAANFPTVRQLLGDEAFDHAAREFVLARPPRLGALARYGVGFADFLGSYAPLAEVAYLSGVAALDRAWTESHLAADAPILDAAEVAALTPERFLASRLVPHPAARWLRFTLPAFTIWRRHREALALAEALAWTGEAALLTRPCGEVAWQAVDPEMLGFLAACASGQSCAAALEGVIECYGGDNDRFDLAAALRLLFAAGAFTRIENDSA